MITNCCFFILSIVFGNVLYAQNIVPIENEINMNSMQSNTYFKDTNGIFDKYIGIWRYTTANKQFTIRFYKVEQISFYPFSGYSDRLRSYIEYKELHNGQWVTIYNTFPAQGQLIIDTQPVYDGIESIRPYMTPNHISFSYTEPTNSCIRYYYGTVYAEYLPNPGGTPQLKWDRKWLYTRGAQAHEPCPDGQMMDMSEFKIPASMILTKIN